MSERPNYDALLHSLALLQIENRKLRAQLANSPAPCAYCSLSREEWATCRAGFPGCSRADDAMLCPHVGEALETEEKLAQMTKERDAAISAYRRVVGYDRGESK